MSAVFLNIGQCGNQLGQCFWQEVEEWTARTFKDASRSSSLSATASSAHSRLKTQQPVSLRKSSRYLPYSLINGTLPCLWIDTDSKVIKAGSKWRTGSALLKERVPGDCCISLPEGSGRGSNWAYGYHGRTRASGGEHLLYADHFSCVRMCVLCGMVHRASFDVYPYPHGVVVLGVAFDSVA